MTLTFSNKALQKKGESEVAAALDKEQQWVGGNLQVEAFLCAKSVSVKIICAGVCARGPREETRWMSLEIRPLFLTFRW